MVQQTEHTYDLFISYAKADRAWVRGYLLPALGLPPGRIITRSDFTPGAPVVTEFERAVAASRYTVLVLSPAYLADEWATFGELLTSHASVTEQRHRLIPLLLHPCDLPLRVEFRVYLDCANPANRESAIAQLRDLLDQPEPESERINCPYPGMVPFSEADSDRFFGRDKQVQELVERLRLYPFITVIGPSGSGKSSLVFAGLVPALQQSGLFGPGCWLVRTVRPGETPLTALAAALGGDPPQAVSALLVSQPEARRLLLVADQFEELFTRARSGMEPFQRALLRLAATPACYVVLTVRADFYPDLMASPLWQEIQAHRLEVSPLDEAGLRQAIVRPAEDTGVFVEPRLVERLVGHAVGEPGSLPLLQETLALLWERLAWHFLPCSAYEALGDDKRTGLQVAMARHADARLAELTENQQLIARRIFLRLVQFGKGRGYTRLQQPVATLRAAGDDRDEFDRALEHLARNRLLTLSGEERGEERQVEIAHEALIAGWPTLDGWLAERYEKELTRRRLEGKAEEWVRLGRSSGGLLDGVELREAMNWLESLDAGELGCSAELIELAGASRKALRTERLRQWITVTSVLIVVLGLLAVFTIGVYREWVRRHTGTELVSIHGGPAIIGADDPAAEPNVTLSSFQIEKYEVSNAQWRACVEFGPCDKPTRFTDRFDNEARGEYPIVGITAQQAHVYCTWLGRRLPTTVEWERAARGTEGRLWPWGNDPTPSVEGYKSPTDLVPVAWEPETATPLPEQIFHLAYNVTEWVVRVPMNCEGASCHQAWDGKAKLIVRIGRAPHRPNDEVAQVAAMRDESPDASDQETGFRCAAESPQ